MDYRLKSDKCLDFNDFTTLIKSLIDITMPKVIFSSSYSDGFKPEIISAPIITYKIIHRVSGNNGSHQEIKPRIREQLVDEESNTGITIYAQKFNYEVEFCIWADSNQKAEAITEEFENMILTYTGDLMKNGIQQIIFLEQGEDNIQASKWKIPLVSRTLRYLVVLEKINIVKESILKTITVRTNQGLIFKLQKEE